MNHLLDPISGTDDYYKEFSEVCGTETTEGVMPSLKTSKDRVLKIPFNPIKQHASNTGLIIDFNESSKPRLVYTAKRLTEAEKKSFNHVMNDIMYTCGATLLEFKDLMTCRINEYPMCTTCKVLKKLPLVLKRKRRKELSS